MTTLANISELPSRYGWDQRVLWCCMAVLPLFPRLTKDPSRRALWVEGGAPQGAGTGVRQPVCLAGLPRDVVQGALGNQFLKCPAYLEATFCAVKKKETWKWYLHRSKNNWY